MVRTPSCDKSGMRKGTWTPEEDRKLTAYVTRYGCWNWRQLPKYAGLSRCGKSCRLRWMNYLRPDLKHGNYTKEEDELIIKLHESIGNRWSAIAAHLPGRTDNEIKNHWHTSLKNASKKASSESKRRSKNRKRRIENEQNPPPSNLTAREILESSEFSSQPRPTTSSSSSASSLLSAAAAASSSELCSFAASESSAGAAESGNELPGENDDFMAEIVGDDSGGSFWTEPFLTDYYSILNYPPSPFASEVLLWSYDYFEDNVNALIW